MFDANDNIALLERSQQGDAEALDELIKANMGLVRSIALRFRGRGAEYEDLVQIGSIGMLKAVKNFDLTREMRFSTYAVPLIIGEIKRFLRDDGIIKVSRSLKRTATDIAAKKTFLSRSTGASRRYPSLRQPAIRAKRISSARLRCPPALSRFRSRDRRAGQAWRTFSAPTIFRR